MTKIVVASVLLLVLFPNHLGAQQQGEAGGGVQEKKVTQIETRGITLDFKTTEIQQGVWSLQLAPGELGETVYAITPAPLMYHGDSFSMLNDTQVQKELELMEDQQKQLLNLQQTFAQQISELVRDRKKQSTKEDGQALKTAIREAREEQRKQMEGILLPHQLDRLKQVALQMKMKSRGDMQMLTDQELAQKLEISEEQKERLKQRAAEIKAEMEDEIAQLKKKARQKLLRELTAEQRKQLEEMLGNEFDYQTIDPRQPLERYRKTSQERVRR